MNRRSIKLKLVVALAGLAVACAAHAQSKKAAAGATRDAVTAEFEKFREVMEDASPAELFEARGEVLWKAKRGPKNASLEQCDLGLGPGGERGFARRLDP